eukprot:gene6988-4952_t
MYPWKHLSPPTFERVGVRLWSVTDFSSSPPPPPPPPTVSFSKPICISSVQRGIERSRDRVFPGVKPQAILHSKSNANTVSLLCVSLY